MTEITHPKFARRSHKQEYEKETMSMSVEETVSFCCCCLLNKFPRCRILGHKDPATAYDKTVPDCDI